MLYNKFYCFLVFPQITMNPNNVTVLIGQSMQLMCRAEGTDIVYQWIKDGVALSDTNRRLSITDRKLKITNIKESDEGEYKCIASNKGGMIVSNPATVTVYGELV